MKKFARVLLSGILAITLSFPASAFAADGLIARVPTSQTETTTDAIANTQSLLTSQAAQEVGDLLPDSLKAVELSPLYDEADLTCEDYPEAVDIQVNQSYGGITFTGKRADIEAGRISFADTFDFGSYTVGRISVDALTDRSYTGKLLVYVDDAAAPIASIDLGHQQGKNGWKRSDIRTQDILAAGLTGVHTVSLALDVKKANDPESNKKTTVLIRSIEFAANSLPTLYFDLDETQGSIEAMNSSENHSKECYGTMRVQTPAGYTCEYTGETTSEVQEQTFDLEYIRGRGNSTWMVDKKPYKVKLDKKADLFGMGANKHWVLLANRYDNSLMRNKLTYWLGAQLGMEYTPQCIFVEVVMNGQYLGSYYLCEQVRVGASRVDIDDLDDEPDTITPPAITGGYLISMDYAQDEEEGHSFATNMGYNFSLESPSFETGINQAQYNYIKDFFQDTENAILDPESVPEDKTSADYLDYDTAIDYYWMQMFSKNGDAYASGSTYLYKKRDTADTPGKLYWGPLWDFDYVAWGDLEYGEPEIEGFDTQSAPWLDALRENKAFNDAFIGRWGALSAALDQATKEGGILDTWYTHVAPSRFYDTETWGVYNEIWDDWGIVEENPSETIGVDTTPTSGRSYLDEVNQLRSWILARQTWVKDNLSLLSMEPCTITFKVDGKTYAQKTAFQGKTLFDFPSDPTKKNNEFAGWVYRMDGDEYLFDSDTLLTTSSITVYATWVESSIAVPVQKIYLPLRQGYLEEGDSMWLDYQIAPTDATNQTITWTSSNTDVATVESTGEIIGIGAGKAVITAASANGVKATFTVVVHGITEEFYLDFAEGIMLNTQEMKIPCGEFHQIGAELYPDPCRYASIRWRSLDPDIADVGAAGAVEGISPGTTYIVAYLENNMDALEYCKVTVTKSRLNIAKIAPQPFIGKQVKPKPVVTFGKAKLKPGRDYTITYGSNKKLGKGTLTIRLTGTRIGTATATFNITPKAPRVVKAKLNNKGKLKVTWKTPTKAARKYITGYQVRWAKAANMKGATQKKLKGAAKKNLVIKGTATVKKAIYVQVRSWTKKNGKMYYSPWTKAKKVKQKIKR